MEILLFLNFVFTCCLGVYFYTQLKEKEDEINELYDMYYKLNEWKTTKETTKKEKVKNKEKRGQVYFIDRNDF